MQPSRVGRPPNPTEGDTFGLREQHGIIKTWFFLLIAISFAINIHPFDTLRYTISFAMQTQQRSLGQLLQGVNEPECLLELITFLLVFIKDIVILTCPAYSTGIGQLDPKATSCTRAPHRMECCSTMQERDQGL